MAVLCVVAAGCVRLVPDSPLPTDGATMREVMSGVSGWRADDEVPDGTEGLVGWTRDAYNELDVRFPRLKNPVIIMYIFPHFSAEGFPVVGYSTYFELYDSAPWALPWEIRHGR